MLAETMNALGFTSDEIRKREYVGEYGEDDAIGLWRDGNDNYCIICFPTPETIKEIKDMQRMYTNTSFVIVNSQLFLDQFSREESVRMTPFVKLKTY